MASPYPAIPGPRQANWLRVLTAIALLAVTFAALMVGVLAYRAQQRIDDVDRAISDTQAATREVQRNANDIEPTLRDLRSASRELRGLRELLGR